VSILAYSFKVENNGSSASNKLNLNLALFEEKLAAKKVNDVFL
jgi:hypothetical protein